MIGSLYAIVMGPTTLENVQSSLDLSNFNIICFIIGGIIIVDLEKLKKILEMNIK